MAFLTRVFVRTNSLFDALYTTSRMRVLAVCTESIHSSTPPITNANNVDEALLRSTARKGVASGRGLRTLRTPGEVARIQAEGAELQVATAGSHGVNALGANACVRSCSEIEKCSVPFQDAQHGDI